MSMTAYEERRTIPSVFSDIPTRDDVQRSREETERVRKRIGQMGMWIFLLVGAMVVAIGVAAVAGYLYSQKSSEFVTLQRAYNDLDNQTGDYELLRKARDDIRTARVALLNRLEGDLRPAQRTAAQQAARAAGFRWTIGAAEQTDTEREATRQANEVSQEWAGLYTHMGQGLQGELQMLRTATENVGTAIVTERPAAPTPVCPDPRREDCGRQR